MSMRLSITLVALLILAPLRAENTVPAISGPEGQRAFDELGLFYHGQSAPDYESALLELNGSNPQKSANAGAYFLALFAQSTADETSGRANWKSLPFWGGGADNIARNFRAQAAEAFSKTADSPNALPATLWLLHQEMVEDNISFGAQVLPRIHSAAADKAIGELLADPHPAEKVLVMALQETGNRKLKDYANNVIVLEQSYRTAVREAARKTASQLGLVPLKDFDSNAAFSPRLQKFLKDTSDRLFTPVPQNALWQEYTQTSFFGSESKPASGWIIPQGQGKSILLDYFAQEDTTSTNPLTLIHANIADTAERLIRWRTDLTALEAASANNQDVSSDKIMQLMEKRGEYSRSGRLTSQAEPSFITLPEITVATWCWQRGDLDHCQRILYPCYNATANDRWIDWASRDYLGNVYHLDMIHQFCNEQDNTATLRLADHLSKAVFDGYNYQPRARELAAQIRADHASVHLLPSPVWFVMRMLLSRDQKITYLASRLKLLHCVQTMQPGDVYYDSWLPDFSLTGLLCINPYLELQRMHLTGTDFATLAPFAADHDFMLTYSYGRDFFPYRTLHRVCWAVQKLVNDSAVGPPPSKTLNELMSDTMKQLNGEKLPTKDILSRANDESVYFTANPQGDVVAELKGWALKQPAPSFWDCYGQYIVDIFIALALYFYFCWRKKHPRRLKS